VFSRKSALRRPQQKNMPLVDFIERNKSTVQTLNGSDRLIG